MVWRASSSVSMDETRENFILRKSVEILEKNHDEAGKRSSGDYGGENRQTCDTSLALSILCTCK